MTAGVLEQLAAVVGPGPVDGGAGSVLRAQNGSLARENGVLRGKLRELEARVVQLVRENFIVERDRVRLRRMLEKKFDEILELCEGVEHKNTDDTPRCTNKLVTERRRRRQSTFVVAEELPAGTSSVKVPVFKDTDIESANVSSTVEHQETAVKDTPKKTTSNAAKNTATNDTSKVTSNGPANTTSKTTSNEPANTTSNIPKSTAADAGSALGSALGGDSPRKPRTRGRHVSYKLPSLRCKMRRPSESLVDATTTVDINALAVYNTAEEAAEATDKVPPVLADITNKRTATQPEGTTTTLKKHKKKKKRKLFSGGIVNDLETSQPRQELGSLDGPGLRFRNDDLAVFNLFEGNFTATRTKKTYRSANSNKNYPLRL
ncbi:Sgo1p KNAG_0L01960 [Huiozyma naganishii CBS 8797]|uniref:Shugoshin C-terminal domain-containing protein n=1 Tax=Huiozyma naganishii (strain ATCC MYA-139 / BCRC 22969 / CBS 8797 / KCTC 17520 / NBRC 10181 / NCYC 3082 / Yp74L-3) TaxID=1071383 RepID=J7RD55_HUIN7|nr:hypothetical protein KNAG_0L01960 [Kazachstania naganishii CBS 8797]CCK72815.1 hypothetical protein KNAG_0L01960 [Kazachstania naganishii CBS 8797]